MSRYSASFDVHVRKKEEEIVQMQEELLNKAQRGKELDISWRRWCSGVSQLRSRNDDDGEDEITVKDRSPSQTGKSAVRSTSERDGADTLAMLKNDVVQEASRVFFG